MAMSYLDYRVKHRQHQNERGEGKPEAPSAGRQAGGSSPASSDASTTKASSSGSSFLDYKVNNRKKEVKANGYERYGTYTASPQTAAQGPQATQMAAPMSQDNPYMKAAVRQMLPAYQRPVDPITAAAANMLRNSARGNIDLYSRPQYRQPDGSISPVNSQLRLNNVAPRPYELGDAVQRFEQGALLHTGDPEADKYIEKSIRTSKNPFVNSGINSTIDPQTGDVTYSAEHGRNNWLNDYNVNENLESDEARKARTDALSLLIARGRGDDRTDYESTVLRNMNEDEQKEYSYILGKFGREQAEKYLDRISENVTNRRAAEIVENVNRDVVPEDGSTPTTYVNPRTGEVIENARSGKNPINTLARAGKKGKLAAQSGLDMFRTGVGDKFTNYVTGGTEVTPATAEARASQAVKEQFSGPGRVAYDVIENSAMMAPTMAATAAATLAMPALAPQVASVGAPSLGAAASAKAAADAAQIFGIGATMFPMSAGQAYEEALQKGMSPNQARLFGTLEGLNQAGLEYALGGFEDLSGGFAKKAVDNVLGNVVADETKSQAAQTVARAVQHFLTTPEGRMAFSMGSEAFEEIVQGSVSNALNNAFFGENNGPVSQEDLYSGLVAALSAGMSNARYYAGRYANGVGRVYSAEDIRAAAGNIITDRAAYVNQEAYDAAMEQRDQMLAQADYVEQGGNLTPLERGELGEAAGGALAEMDRIGRRARNESDIQEVTDALKTAQEIAQTEETKQEVEKISTRANDIIKRRAEGAQVTDAEVGRLINDTIRTTLTAGNEKAAATAEARTRMGFGEQGNTVMESSQATGQKAEALTALYEEARYDIQRNEAQKQLASTLLSEQELSAMYQAGIQDRNAFYNTDYSDKIGKIAEKYRPGNIKRGNVTYDGVDMDALQKAGDNESRTKYAQMKTIEHFLAGTLGYNVEWFESKTADGKYEGENGSYNRAKHLIRLDINAGAEVIGDKVKFANVIAHELTHTIEDGSPMQYQKIADTVMKALVADQEYSRGRNAEQIVADMIENNPYVKNEADAVHELVAQACEDMMNGNADVRAMFEGMSDSERNTIFDHISNIFAAVKNFLDDLLNSDSVRSNRTEAAAIRRAKENIESLEKEWTEGVKRAAAYNAAAYEESQRIAAETEAADAEYAEDHNSQMDQFSVRQFAETFGFELKYEKFTETDANGEEVTRYYKLYDPVTKKPVKRVTAKMMDKTPMGTLVNAALAAGSIDEKVAAKQKKMFADLMNLTIQYDNLPMVWEIAGAQLFSAIKSNSDAQYGSTVDFGTVCAKTQAIVDTMSRVMVEKGRGLTRAEVIKVYNEVANNGLSVPCPVCYVFSRWMGVPSLLENMRKCQERFSNMSNEEINEYVHSMEEKYGQDTSEKEDGKKKKPSALINEEKTRVQNRVRAAEEELRQARISKQGVEEALKNVEALQNELNDLEAYNWVTQVLCKTNRKREAVRDAQGNVTKDPKYKAVPTEILLDLTRTGEFADPKNGYSKSWVFRTTRGAGMGKAILPYSGATLGDTVRGAGSSSPTRYNPKSNPFLNMLLTFDKKGNAHGNAIKDIRAAIKRIKAQNLIGGQRFQSTSDFRAEWGIDYLMTFLEAQAIGAKGQLYTKVIEAVDMFASAGIEVNLSIMGKGNGYHMENGKPVLGVEDFSSVTGIDFSKALEKTKKYSNVQMILVGLNDTHIRLALADDRITFIIPWHSSGSNEATLKSLMSGLNETLENGTDYSDTQSDGVIPKEQDPEYEKHQKMRDLRKAIVTGQFYEKSKNAKSKTRYLTEAEQQLLNENAYLNNLYNMYYVDETSDAYGIKLSGTQAMTSKGVPILFPYEYWDKTSTIKNADVNGQRFQDYCASLGMIPRFSGFVKDGVTYGNFTKDPGYWKLLIDRRMYDLKGKYHAPSVIDVTKVKVGSVPTSVNSNNYKDTESIDAAVRDSLMAIDNVGNEMTVEEAQMSARDTTVGTENDDAGLYITMRSALNDKGNGWEFEKIDSEYDLISPSGEEKWFNSVSDAVAYYVKQTGDDSVQKRIDATAEFQKRAAMRRERPAADRAKDSTGRKLSKAMQEYMKDSKMRNANGQLKPMFHGSETAGFTVFDRGSSDDKLSLFFSDDPYVSESYIEGDVFGFTKDAPVEDVETFADRVGYFTEYEWEVSEDGLSITDDNGDVHEFNTPEETRDYFVDHYDTSGVYEVYLNITNPLELDAKGAIWNNLPSEYNGKKIDGTDTRAWAAFAYENGYDGVIFRNIVDNGGNGLDDYRESTVAVAFNSNQVKSVHNQNPTANEDIRYSTRDSSGKKLTEAQAEYFKNSKIRDADGNLQVMYHGTNADFNVFDTSISGGVNGTAEGFGIYLADRSDVSDAYGGRLIKAYVNVTKPASSNKKTITKSTLKKLIKATAMSEAEKFVADGDYENVNDAVKDSWISNYTNTYEKSLSASLDDVSNQLLRMDDNDMGIIQEVMAGMGIRDYADAYDFYDILKRVTGFDGFETWWTNAKNQGDPARIVLAFDSNQVKNIDNENPTESADIRYSSRDTGNASTFYSKLQREIQNYKGDKIGAASVESYLKGKGVKDEEIKWSGIRTFLEGKKSVSKAELMDYLKANELEIEETTLTGATDFADSSSGRRFKSIRDIDNYIENELGYKDYSAYYENYTDQYVVWINDGSDDGIDMYFDKGEGGTQWSEYTLDGGDNYREILFRMPNSDYTNSAMSTHWGNTEDGLGVLAHARIQDFSTDNGENVLFIEEIQSDWHNEGQKKGYATAAERKEGNRALKRSFEIPERAEKTFSGYNWYDLLDLRRDGKLEGTLGKEKAEKFKEIYKEYEETTNKGKSADMALDAPFRTTYTDFVLKDLLRMAAEGDYDYLAWTTGKMQEERWSDEYAEGYRIEYDQQIPKFLKKYGKQWGAGLTEVTVGGNTVPAIVVNDAMKESVLTEGQPMYSARSNGFDQRTSLGTVEELERRNENIWHINYTLDQVLRDRGAQTQKISDHQIKRIANRFIREYGSKADVDTIANGLKSMYEYIDSGAKTSAQQVGKIATAFAEQIIDESKDVDDTMAAMYPGLADDIKRTKLYVSPEAMKEMAYYFDGAADFRRQAKKFLTISERSGDGRGIDTFYEELSESYPELFDPNVANEKDQLLQIFDVAEQLKAKTIDKDWGSEYDEVAYTLGQDLVAAYFAEKGDSSYKRSIDQIKAQMTKDHKEQMANLRRYKDQQIKEIKDKLTGERRVNTAQIAELRARLQEQYRQREEKASLRRLTTQAKAKLQRQARQLWSKRGTPEFERLKAKLFSELDLVSIGITKGGRLSLEKTYNEARRQAALDPDYAASAEYENIKLKYLGDPANPTAERKHLRDLSYDEIVDLTQDIIALKHSQQTYNKVIKEGFEADVADYGRRAVVQQDRVKGILNQKGRRATMLAAVKKYALYMENPVRAAHLLDGYQGDGVLTELFDDINDGTTKKTRFQQQANQMFEEILKDKKLTDGWSDQNIEINVGAGKYYISKGMRISIALHVRNADNIRHIDFGGFTIPDERLYKAGRYTDAYNAGTNVKMTEEEMKQIASEMTPEEKKFAGIAYQFFNHTTKDAINETSMILKGYELAIVPNYMPIRTNPNFTQTEIDGLIHDGTIEGKGQFKDRQPGAKNPILLEDIAQVIERQTQTTAAYYGLAIPVRNMNKVWKYTATAYKASIKDAVAKNWGELGKETVEKMLQDIQAGARRGDTGDHVFSFLKGAQAAATLTMNVGVSMKQFASYALAISMIDADCLMKGLKAKTDRAYIDSITPWSWDRRHGMGGEEMSDIFRQKGMIARNQTVQNIKNMVNWIQAVDVFTTDHLFSACEAQVQKDNPDLEVRGEEYNKKVAALYNDVLWRTQPSYGVMQRNELMRSASSIMKALTMYKTQTFNMGGEIIDAGLRAITMNDMAKNGFVSNDEAKKAGQDLKKVLWGTVLSQATLAALSAVAAAVLRKMRPYRDDKGEITAGSLMQKVGTDFITSWFGLFFGADLAEQAVGSVLNFAKWYDVTAPQLDGLNDTVSDMSAWSTALGDYIGEADADKKAEKKAKLVKTSAKMAMTTAGTFGVPTTNVYNMLNALNLLLQDVSEDGGGFLSFEAGEGLLGLTDTSPTKEQYARQAVYYSERDDADKVAHALQGTNKANLEKVLGAKLTKNLYDSFMDDPENLAKFLNVKQGVSAPKPSDVPDEGYASFTKLREAIGDPERTQNWHHIVEQEQGPGNGNFGNFNATQINNKNNIVSIPSGAKSPHSAISQYYDSVQDFTGGKTVREWLSTKSFEEQFDFGVKQLQKYGDIIPTGNGWVFVPDDKKIEALIPLSKGKKEERTETQKRWETQMAELREDGSLTGREVRDAALTMLKDGLSADEAIELYRSNQKSDKNLDKWKGGFEDYLNSRNAIDDAKAIKDSDKKRQKEKRKQAVEDYLRQYHGTKEDELLLWKLAGYGEKTFVYR